MNKERVRKLRGARRMQEIIKRYEAGEKLKYREKSDLDKIIPKLKLRKYTAILKRVPTHLVKYTRPEILSYR